MARIALICALPDRQAVWRIAAALRAAGHDAWLDEQALSAGTFVPKLSLHNADFVVICLSKAAKGWIEYSPMPLLQLGEANAPIVTVRLEDIAPPNVIAAIAYEDLFPDEQAFDNGIARLTLSIAEHTARSATTGNADAVTEPQARREVESQALGRQLDDAYARKQRLEEAGEATGTVVREIVELKRRLREGGQLRSGDRLGADGRYHVVEELGRGGFATVWKAKDRVASCYVAIKVLHANLAGDPLRRERFFRGARVMMELKHAAVVRVLEPKGEDGGFYYFVMESVAGGNLHKAVLAQRVKRNDVFPLILQVGEALAEAHGRRLVHRDIKPANILIDEQGNAKLTDFDLVGAHDTTGGTGTGALGTAIYAAPECLHKPQDATARADVFGLGMTAIFCLSGQDLSMDTLVDRAGALAQLDCTTSVRRVLERAVEWKPERRFADAAAMVDALRDALAGSARTATADDDAATPREDTDEPMRDVEKPLRSALEGDAPEFASSAVEVNMTRDGLLTVFTKLLPAQFEEVLYRAEIPSEYLSANSAPQATRAIEVIRYLELQNRIPELARVVERVVKANATTATSPEASIAAAQPRTQSERGARRTVPQHQVAAEENTRPRPQQRDSAPSPHYRGANLVAVPGMPAARAQPPRLRWLLIGGSAVIAIILALLVARLVRDDRAPPASAGGTASAPARADVPPPATRDAAAEAAAGDPEGATTGDTEPPAGDATPDENREATADGMPVVGSGPCRFTVTTTPAGAAVRLDDQPMGPSPITIGGSCDKHKVDVAHVRYQAVTKWVTLSADKPQELDISLQRPIHTVTVTSYPPGAELSIDGHLAGTTPTVVQMTGFATVNLTFTKRGFQTVTRKVYSQLLQDRVFVKLTK